MRSPFKIVKVKGHSMEPLIRSGQLLLINQWAYLWREPRIGDIVIFRNPRDNNQLLCKRVANVTGEFYTLLGDNRTDSLDSSVIGPVKLTDIAGKVLR